MTWFTRHRADEPATAPATAEARRAALRRRYDPRQKGPADPHTAQPVRRPDVRKAA